jgi:hypothetical protein
LTEGTGHVIDPAGDARRAVQEAVNAYGPGVLSDATAMENLCRTQLTALPGECILIVSAARADVPALLRDKIPELGNYGAIQSVATTLAGAHDLDNAASLWVVREFGRALGLIAPGGTQSTPRPAPGGAGAEAAGGAVATGAAGTGAAGGAGGGAPSGPGAPAESGGGTGVPGGPGAPGGAEFAPGMAGGPQPGMAGGPQPGMAGAGAPAPRGSSGSKLLNRNTVGVAAAIALVAGYLGVAAAAHLSPFPAKTVAATSSPPPSTGPSTSPATSPAASPDASPTSDYDILLSKIPATVQGQNNCRLTGTQYGAIAVSQCSRLSLPAGTIIYYLFPSTAALTSGISKFLSGVHFHKEKECTTGSDFTDFLVECQSDFNNKTPFMTGSIAEYTSTSNDPIIVSTDNQQNVMAVMVGTNAGDLLSYWKKLEWIKD